MLLFVGGGLAHSKPWSVGGGKVRAVHACLLHGLAAVCERYVNACCMDLQLFVSGCVAL